MLYSFVNVHFFFFFLSPPYLWNRHSYRLQIECAGLLSVIGNIDVVKAVVIIFSLLNNDFNFVFRYLRHQKPYTPPRDVATTVLELSKKYMGNNITFSDATTKYKVLTECSLCLNHAVPNSLIHKITGIGKCP